MERLQFFSTEVEVHQEKAAWGLGRQTLVNKRLLVSADYGNEKRKLLSPAQLKKNLPAMQETWV